MVSRMFVAAAVPSRTEPVKAGASTSAPSKMRRTTYGGAAARELGEQDRRESPRAPRRRRALPIRDRSRAPRRQSATSWSPIRSGAAAAISWRAAGRVRRSRWPGRRCSTSRLACPSASIAAGPVSPGDGLERLGDVGADVQVAGHHRPGSREHESILAARGSRRRRRHRHPLIWSFCLHRRAPAKGPREFCRSAEPCLSGSGGLGNGAEAAAVAARGARGVLQPAAPRLPHRGDAWGGQDDVRADGRRAAAGAAADRPDHHRRADRAPQDPVGARRPREAGIAIDPAYTPDQGQDEQGLRRRRGHVRRGRGQPAGVPGPHRAVPHARDPRRGAPRRRRAELGRGGP